MAVPVQIPFNSSTAAADATVFAYNFKILDSTDLLVKVNNVTQTLNTHYTVDGIGADTGGNVTFLAPLAGGETVTRRRNMSYARAADYQALGDLRTGTVNNDFDAAVLMIQQLAENVPDLPLPEALKPLVWNAAGTELENGDTTLTGDMLLRPSLASTINDSFGAGLVGYRMEQASGAIGRTLLDKMREVVSLKDFGAAGDGTTDDTVAIQAAFDYCIVNDKALYVPPGTYIIDAMATGALVPVYLNFTAAGQSLRVYGAGREVSVFKEKAGATLAGGRYTQMFYLYVTSNIDVKDISFTDVTFDKNGASNGPEPSAFLWEQAHIFDLAGNWALAPDAYIESISFVRTNIRDKVGGGYKFSPKMRIGRMLFDDFYESDFSELFGERGDIEPGGWCEDFTFNNVRARYIQTEPVSGLEASAGKEKKFKFNNCVIRWLELGETSTSPAYASFVISNSRVTEEFSTRGLNCKAVNSSLRFALSCWASEASFANCDIVIPYDSGTNAATPVYVKAIAGYPQRWTFGSDCRFILDSDDPAVLATGAALGEDAHAKATAAGEHVIVADGCWFDPRLQRVCRAYATGDFHIRNSTLACWGTPAMAVGGFSTYIGRLYLSGNDYSGCAGAKLVELVRSNALWEFRWDETLPLTQYKITYSASTPLGTSYQVRPSLSTPSIPSSAVPTYLFFAGDRAKNTLPSATSPVTEWVCITDGTPGVWRAAAWLTIKGTTASRPTLTASDIGVTYLDTTLAAAGQLISWTGTAWVDSAGVAV